MGTSRYHGINGPKHRDVYFDEKRVALVQDTTDWWRYLTWRIKQSLQLIQRTTVVSARARLREVIDDTDLYYKTLLGDLRAMEGEEWRKESEDLSHLIQERIHSIQNPQNCAKAKKLLCLPKIFADGCGFGCTMHKIMYCLNLAYVTGRTLILESRGWWYSPGGYEKAFLPLSETCTAIGYGPLIPWSNHTSSSHIVYVGRTRDFPNLPDEGIPTIPDDIGQRLRRFHGNPLAWWTGQFFEYLLRLQPEVQQHVDDVTRRVRFKHPIVGVHIRRTDKVDERTKEANPYPLWQYMAYVEEYYAIEDLKRESSRAVKDRTHDVSEWKSSSGNDETEKREHKERRVYLATDEPPLRYMAEKNYPNYTFLYYEPTNPYLVPDRTIRHTYASLMELLAEVTMLSNSDYLVCTLSSTLCRVVYSLMQTRHIDASHRFTSLDWPYRLPHLDQRNMHVVVMRKHQRRSPGELNLQVGDIINLLPDKRTSSMSWGVLLRSNELGSFPTYKVKPFVETTHINYPR